MKKLKHYFELFGDMLKEWKWILKYSAKYKFVIFLYIIISIVGMAMSLGSTVATKYLIDAVVSKYDDTIFRYAALVIGLSLFNMIFRSAASWITAKVGTKTNNEMRSEIYDNMISAHWEEIKKYHSGDLLNRIEGDVSSVSSGVIGFIPTLFTNMLQFLGSLGIVLYYDKTMAVLSLMSAPVLFFSSRYLITKMRSFNKQSRELNGEVLSFTTESMQNVQFLKAFDLIGNYIENFKNLLERYREVRLKYEKFSILVGILLSFIGMAVSYGCYGWGVYRLWKGAISYGTMTLFLQISGRLTGSFNAIASMVPSAVSIATSAGRIMEITEYSAEEDKDAEKAKKMVADSENIGISVYADNIDFIYNDGEEKVISGASFEVHPGETIAFIGPSGEGKSTLLKLLLGLMSPTQGRLYIEDKDGKTLDVSDSTRRFCSYVPQEMGLFTGTVEYNLRLGNPEATEEEMIEALKAADAWSFVSELPDGLNTKISEQAANISRGQAQRIAIARAMLRKSRILLMDEATSALDIETEERVLANIMQTDPAKVCIITTHRESMLQYCTAIYKITADGNLIKTK